jgi:hypothetical protein
MACEKNNHLVQTADNGSVIGRIHKMNKTSSVTQAFTGKGGGGRIKYFINERDASCPTQRLNLKDGGKRKEE